MRKKQDRSRKVNQRWCKSRKNRFNTYDVALGALRRLNKGKKDVGNIYWCVKCGGYHITELTLDEYRRKRSKPWIEGDENDTSVETVAVDPRNVEEEM